MTTNFLRTIDLFVYPIHMRIKDKIKIKSLFGGILSIIMVVSIGVITFFIGRDIIERKNPYTYDQDKSTLFPNINLNKSSFPIAMSLGGRNGSLFKDGSYLTIQAIYHQGVGSGEFMNLVNSTVLDLKICKLDDFPSISSDLERRLKSEKYWCIENFNLNIQGYWSHPSINFLEIQIKMCDYDLTPNYCKSRETMRKTIANKKLLLGFLMINNDVDVREYTNF